MNLRALESPQFRQRVGEAQKDEIGTGAGIKPNVVVLRLHGVKFGCAQLVWKPRQYGSGSGFLRRLASRVCRMRLERAPLNQVVDANHGSDDHKDRQIEFRQSRGTQWLRQCQSRDEPYRNGHGQGQQDGSQKARKHQPRRRKRDAVKRGSNRQTAGLPHSKQEQPIEEAFAERQNLQSEGVRESQENGCRSRHRSRFSDWKPWRQCISRRVNCGNCHSRISMHFRAFRLFVAIKLMDA